MSDGRGEQGGDVNWGRVAALAAVALVIVTLLLVTATAHVFPFASATGSSSTSTTITTPTSTPTTSTTTAASTSTTTTASTPPPGSVVWGPHDVTLAVNRYYALDHPPITPLDSCSNCVWVGDAPGAGLALQAANVDAWTKPGRPSYRDCADQLRFTSSTAASLVEGPYTTGVSPGAWLCAASQSEEILRLQYKGADSPGNNYYFAVTAWPKP